MSAAAPHRVLFVASECYPLLKTGGLADVAGALPRALMAMGQDVRVLLPAFPKVKAAAAEQKKVAKIKDLFGGPATVLEATADTGLKLFLLNAPHLFDIKGNPYLDEEGQDRADNALRYGGFARAAADLAMGRLGKWHADLVHAHDWQAGLVSAYLQKEGAARPKTVFTIHNLAFQGLFPKTVLKDLELPADLFGPDGLEYWDKVSFLKAGIVYSDHVTTVSPSYAAEIRTEDGGMGFGGLLASLGDRLSGIVNGIDTEVWNPAADPAIAAPFSQKKLTPKAKAKRALQKEFGIRPDKHAPVFSVVSRLTEQKGLDLLVGALPHLVGNGAQLVVLGSGDAALEDAFAEAAKTYKGNVGTFIGYNEDLSHRVQAGSDFIFIPSRFEPCGLTQLCAMRYGTLPVVARVGGLADTVIDANLAALQSGAGTGLQFSPPAQEPLNAAIDRALSLFGDKPTFRKVMKNAMGYDVSWDRPAAAYGALYDRLIQL